MSAAQYHLEDLLRVMQRLRDPQYGCPWDLQQDFRSIVSSTLEECYELVDAIERGDFPHLEEELGDVLFQLVFYTQLGREQGLFDFSSVVDRLVRKLLRRHPHVFADGQIEALVERSAAVAEVAERWESIKQQERQARREQGLLADVPLALPALPRAQKLQKRAATVNFDWSEADTVFDKIEEELAELRAAVAAGHVDAIEDEMGDVLFSCVNLSRHLRVDAESSLRRASAKFESRVQSMEQLAKGAGTELGKLDSAQLERLWQAAKRR